MQNSRVWQTWYLHGSRVNINKYRYINDKAGFVWENCDIIVICILNKQADTVWGFQHAKIKMLAVMIL